MHLQEITATRQLEALGPEWSALWERCVGATPFQTPEWLLPWWRSLGRGELRGVALRQGGRLVESIEGDFDNVVGLPVRALTQIFKREFWSFE